MSKFLAAIRKLFSKNQEEKKEKDESDEPREPNKYQKADKKPRMYEEVVMGEDGPEAVADEPSVANNFQVPPPKGPRQYEEVDLPTENRVQVAIK